MVCLTKVCVELNSPAVRALLKSPEMEALLKEHADGIAARAGKGYAADTRQMGTRAIASAYTETLDAMRDNLKNNTLLRSMK